MKSENPFTIHLLVTSICDRDCKYCCNKQYDLNNVPYVTKEELKNAELVCLTGGEPFKYSNPNAIAEYLKAIYHVKKVIVYSNAFEFNRYIREYKHLENIDGVTISIKTQKDRDAFEEINFEHEIFNHVASNLLYVFPGFEDVECPPIFFQKQKREWQTTFKPAENSIFRRI